MPGGDDWAAGVAGGGDDRIYLYDGDALAGVWDFWAVRGGDCDFDVWDLVYHFADLVWEIDRGVMV